MSAVRLAIAMSMSMSIVLTTSCDLPENNGGPAGLPLGNASAAESTQQEAPPAPINDHSLVSGGAPSGATPDPDPTSGDEPGRQDEDVAIGVGSSDVAAAPSASALKIAADAGAPADPAPRAP